MSISDLEQVFSLSPAEIGDALIRRGEDQWFDRKNARISARDLADSIVGFANAEGGAVVVGLSQGRVEGVDSQPQHVHNSWRQVAFDFTVPAVQIRIRLLPCWNHLASSDHLFVLEVESSSQVHSNRRDEVFLRVGDENRRLTYAQRQELMYEKGQASFEATGIPRVRLDECNQELLSEYADAVGHSSPKRLLQARGLIDSDDLLTVAGALLFLEHPQRLYPEAYVRVLRYRGSQRGTGARQQVVEDERCEGPIPRVLDQAREVVARLLPTRRALGTHGRFEECALVPEDAWFEGVVNAVVHRAYSISGDHIRVEIFDDRIEMESPGRFPGLADLADPRAVPRYARNPRIARTCAELRYGQELGEGIRRMFEEMRLAGLTEPTFTQTSGSARLVLAANPASPELEELLPRGGLVVLNLLRQAGQGKTGELVRDSGMSRPTVLRLLKGLEEAGLVEWVGRSRRDPTAYWRPVG